MLNEYPNCEFNLNLKPEDRGISALDNTQCLPLLHHLLEESDFTPDYMLTQFVWVAPHSELEMAQLQELIDLYKDTTTFYLNYDQKACLNGGHLMPLSVFHFPLKGENVNLSVIGETTGPFHHPFQGFNHVRLLVSPYNDTENIAVFSTINTTCMCPDDEKVEPLYCVKDPEAVEILKGLFFFERDHRGEKFIPFSVVTKLGNEFVFDSGMSPNRNLVIEKANNFLDTRTREGDEVTVVSTFYPNAIEESLLSVRSLGAEIKVICLDPLSNLALFELPFIAVKELALLQSKLRNNTYFSVRDFHGKFILISHLDGTFDSFATTSCLTIAGQRACSKEMASITKSQALGEYLKTFVQSLL